MNHPEPERWMEYLYGELATGARVELDAHLAHCPECQARVETWRATMRGLDEWPLPTKARRVALAQPLVKWGLAAGLVLGLGFGWGRASVAGDLAKIRSALVPELRQQLQKEWAADWQAALAADPAAATNNFHRQLRAGLDRFAAHALLESTAQTRRWLADFARSYDVIRAEDHQAFLALLEEADQRRQADYATLRKDLETVAVLTEGRLDTAQQEIGQLAAFRQSEPNPTDSPQKSLKKSKGN